MDAWHRNGSAGTAYEKINLPVLIAAGTEDIVIPPSNALRLVNAIPGAWLAQFNGGGHAFMAQYPSHSPTSSIAFSSLGERLQRARLHQRLTRPGLPAFTDRLSLAINVYLFQLFYAIFYCFRRVFIFFPGGFETTAREKAAKEHSSQRSPAATSPQFPPFARW